MFTPELFLVYVVTGAIVLLTVLSVFSYKDTDHRSVKLLKRKVRKATILTMGVSFAFIGSLTIGQLIGTLGASENNHSVTEAGISPIFIIFGFLAVLAIAGIVAFSIVKCVQNMHSRSAHA